MKYQIEARNPETFVQAIENYLRWGYYHFVLAMVPARKPPWAYDEKVVRRYQLDRIDKDERYRRKRRGEANVQFVRHGRIHVTMATDGEGRFFCPVNGEGEAIRDARESSIVTPHPLSCWKTWNGGERLGYDVSARVGFDGKYHASVRMCEAEFEKWKARLFELAAKRSKRDVIREFDSVPFAPWGPIVWQLDAIRRGVNERRQWAGLDLIEASEIPRRRKRLRVYVEAPRAA